MQILTLTSADRSSLSSKEFFSALALTALAQKGERPSLEALANLQALPLPRLQSKTQTNGYHESPVLDRTLETISVTLIPEKEGWFLQKYTLASDVRDSLSRRSSLQKRDAAVSRRYSDFVWLADCLSKRYVSELGYA